MNRPANWIEARLGEICSVEIGGTPSRRIPEYWDAERVTQNTWVSIRDMHQRIIFDTAELISDAGVKHSNTKLQPKGTVLLSFKLTIGCVAMAGVPLYTNEAIAGLKPIGDLKSEYLYHGLQYWDLLQDVDQAIKGATLNKEKLKCITFFFPELTSEQTKIAEILSTVDQAIEQTEALIAKQQRIKTGLMQDLLTRGIDKNGNLRSEDTHEFKDSPLGRIPVEWDVVKVKDIARIVTGNKDTQDRDDSADYPFFVRSQQVEHIGSYSFDGEAVLTAGDGVGTGKVFHFVNGKFDFHQRVYCLHSFDPGMDGYFFFHFFQANFMDRVAQFSAKGSVDSVRMAMIADMSIPQPNLEEQQRSAAILREVETVLSECAKSTEKLKALKTALMQDLLTGEVSVTPLLTEADIHQ